MKKHKRNEALPIKTGRENIYCAFYTGNECLALNKIYCANGPCRFYKTKTQLKEEYERSKHKFK